MGGGGANKFQTCKKKKYDEKERIKKEKKLAKK